MANRINENDYLAMDTACKIMFGKNYAEFIDFLISLGNILTAIMEQQDRAETTEANNNLQPEPEASLGQIGFKTC